MNPKLLSQENLRFTMHETITYLPDLLPVIDNVVGKELYIQFDGWLTFVRCRRFLVARD